MVRILMDLMTTVDTTRYVAIPFNPTPARAGVVSAIMRGIMEFETVFTDYQKPCMEVCGECEACARARASIALMLSRPDSRSWEVWDTEGEGLVGLLYVTQVIPTVDAKAHYVFFDRKLSDKTGLLEGMIQWAFQDHDDWKPLKRLTVEIPEFAFATARHAAKKLGFGGDFIYRKDGKMLPVEGVKRKAIRWRGSEFALLQMGRVN